MQLFQAHNQWKTRPKDERFDSLESLYAATRKYYSQAGQKVVNVKNLRVEADGKTQDITLVGKEGVGAQLTHWAFGQLSQRVGAPANYLRQLPATLAAQNMNYGLANYCENGREEDAKVNLLFHMNGSLLLRAFTSDKSGRR